MRPCGSRNAVVRRAPRIPPDRSIGATSWTREPAVAQRMPGAAGSGAGRTTAGMGRPVVGRPCWAYPSHPVPTKTASSSAVGNSRSNHPGGHHGRTRPESPTAAPGICRIRGSPIGTDHSPATRRCTPETSIISTDPGKMPERRRVLRMHTYTHRHTGNGQGIRRVDTFCPNFAPIWDLRSRRNDRRPYPSRRTAVPADS